MARYEPPTQSKFGQIVDVIVLLALTIGALYIPLWLGLAGSAHVAEVPENPTWESLGQNPVMVEKWNQPLDPEADRRFAGNLSWKPVHLGQKRGCSGRVEPGRKNRRQRPLPGDDRRPGHLGVR